MHGCYIVIINDSISEGFHVIITYDVRALQIPRGTLKLQEASNLSERNILPSTCLWHSSKAEIDVDSSLKYL